MGSGAGPDGHVGDNPASRPHSWIGHRCQAMGSSALLRRTPSIPMLISRFGGPTSLAPFRETERNPWVRSVDSRDHAPSCHGCWRLPLPRSFLARAPRGRSGSRRSFEALMDYADGRPAGLSVGVPVRAIPRDIRLAVTPQARSYWYRPAAGVHAPWRMKLVQRRKEVKRARSTVKVEADRNAHG